MKLAGANQNVRILLGMALLAAATSYFEPDGANCGSSVGCVMHPYRCKGRRCQVLVTFREDSVDERKDAVSIEMLAKSDGWFALGFSLDQHMSQDDVYTCVLSPSGQIELRHYYNFGRRSFQFPMHGVTHIEGGYSDGYLSCRFTRLKTVPDRRSKKVHDLSREYYFLLPTGEVAPNGTLLKHAPLPLVSKFKAYLRFENELIEAVKSHDPDDHDPNDNERYQSVSNSAVMLTAPGLMVWFLRAILP
ncbi:DOMON domain-containing protein FRRS1L-like [Ptychodera flava]|uniref:DOMON domain-containing protein FRRS1L-like n=1 Tax=Ptychodera flava TaxID=63121 RepID=UPI003969C0AD